MWPRVTSFSMFLSIIDLLIFAQGRLEYSLGALGPDNNNNNTFIRLVLNYIYERAKIYMYLFVLNKAWS